MGPLDDALDGVLERLDAMWSVTFVGGSLDGQTRKARSAHEIWVPMPPEGRVYRPGIENEPLDDRVRFEVYEANELGERRGRLRRWFTRGSRAAAAGRRRRSRCGSACTSRCRCPSSRCSS